MHVCVQVCVRMCGSMCAHGVCVCLVSMYMCACVGVCAHGVCVCLVFVYVSTCVGVCMHMVCVRLSDIRVHVCVVGREQTNHDTWVLPEALGQQQHPLGTGWKYQLQHPTRTYWTRNSGWACNLGSTLPSQSLGAGSGLRTSVLFIHFRYLPLLPE